MILGNLTPVPPPLHGGVIAMLKFPGHRSDAAEARYDGAVVRHWDTVRDYGTTSQLDCVRQSAVNAFMTGGESVGEHLRALKERSGLSLQTIADKLEAPKKSSIQRFFEPDYRPGGLLDLEDAIRFASVFVGKGDPPIEYDDVLNLTALPQVPIRRADDVPPLSDEVSDVLADVLGKVAAGRALSADERATLASIIRGISELFRTDLSARENPERTRGALNILVLQHGGPSGAPQ